MYVVLTPLLFAGLRQTLCRHRSQASFLATLAVSLWVCAAGVLGWFAFRVVDKEEWWTDTLKYRYQARIGCDPTKDCLASYLMWFAPCVASFVAFVLGVLCYLLSASTSPSQTGMDHKLRAFGLVMAAVVMGLWIAVQVAGSARQLSSVVLTFSMASLLIAAMMLGSTVGWSRIKDSLYSVPLFASLVAAATDWGLDVFKAVLISSPVVVFAAVYLAFSAANQAVRRLGVGKKFDSPEERRLWVTATAADQLAEVKSWRWTGIITTVHWWIIVVMSLVVLAGTFTVVFLSWVRVVLDGSSLAVIYVIFYLVGITMFLNPFIPGLPVYITGGIMLTDKPFLDAFGGAAGYPGSYVAALSVAVLFCFGIKLSAVVLQQKVIGENLGKRVWVRSLVNVNSITMRAIRRILLQPGLSFPKMCILVGGPDWPVSVTTGILRCDVFQMLFGTLPVVFIIAPSVMSGAFMLKIGQTSGSGEEICPALPPPPPPPPPVGTVAHGDLTEAVNPWESVSQVSSVLTAFVQSAGLLAGLYYIEKVSAEHRAELESEAPDVEVLKIDEEKARKRALYARVTEWSRLPGAVKLLLSVSVVVITVSYWAILIGPSFLPPETMIRNYVLTDCVSVKLEGKFWTVVTTTGWFFLAMFGASCVMLWIFGKWAAAAMAAEVSECEYTPDDVERRLKDSAGSQNSGEDCGDATGAKAAAPRPPPTKSKAAANSRGGGANGADEDVFSRRSPLPAGRSGAGAGAFLSRFADEKVADTDRNFKLDFERKLPGMSIAQLGDLRAAWSDRRSAGYSSTTHAQVMDLIDAEIERQERAGGE